MHEGDAVNTIRVWNAFAANNSVEYRLVADFSTVEQSHAAAADLRALFDAAPETDSWMPEGDPTGPPEVLVSDTRLVLYSHYCLGFPDELKNWLTSTGAQLAAQPLPIGVSMAFARPATLHTDELERSLRALGAQLQRKSAHNERVALLPWSEEQFVRGACGFFSDGETVFLHFPSSSQSLELARSWLTTRGVTSPRVTLCEEADATKFNGMYDARCPACAAPVVMRYVAPERYGVDQEQLACTACGGMYEVPALLTGTCT